LPSAFNTSSIINNPTHNIFTLSWWAYFLILSVGAGALALALLMAESVCIICHQQLAHQQAQEITWNHHTTLLCQPSIELATIITTPTPVHASDYRAHRIKPQGHVFTPVDFNICNSSHSNILSSTNYMTPPAPTYPVPYPLCPDLPTLGTNPEIFIHSPTPPMSPTKSSPMHFYPPGLHNKPS